MIHKLSQSNREWVIALWKLLSDRIAFPWFACILLDWDQIQAADFTSRNRMVRELAQPSVLQRRKQNLKIQTNDTKLGEIHPYNWLTNTRNRLENQINGIVAAKPSLKRTTDGSSARISQKRSTAYRPSIPSPNTEHRYFVTLWTRQIFRNSMKNRKHLSHHFGINLSRRCFWQVTNCYWL